VKPVITEVAFLWLLPLFPLLGAAINGLFGTRLQARYGKPAVAAVAIGAMLGAAAVALFAFFGKLLPAAPEARYLHDQVWSMVAIADPAGALRADFALAVDPLSGVMLLVITLIGTLIHVYAASYMHDEPSYWRFFAYLNLFVFSMLLLVLGDSLLLMFFGWEGVGLCSYLLIGFWYQDRAKAAAGMKAFVVNRVGDFGFICGACLLFWNLPEPTVVFREIGTQLADPAMSAAFLERTLFGVPVVLLACLGLFLGACGKSAQVPLFVWLPDAMEGPTPVSALIHAATMVTAGVYMIARLGGLFALSPDALTVISLVGAVTALGGATIGLVQYDLKKVLAYSTVSQLGFMFMGVGSGAFHAGTFHLVTHACFKACLFLGAGSVIHGMHYLAHSHAHSGGHDTDLRGAPDPADPQDLRNLGGLAKLMPRTRWTYLAACFAIAGFPFAAGFYSKDEILWRAFSSQNLAWPWVGKAVWAAGLVAAACTSFYMFRSYYLVFHHRAPSEAAKAHAHESPAAMTFVLAALAVASVVVGCAFGLPAAWTHHAPVFEQFLAPVFAASASRLGFAHGSLPLELGLQAASVGVAVLGFVLARALYLDASADARLAALRVRFAGVHRTLYEAYRVDALYHRALIAPLVAFAGWLARFDGGMVDGLVNAMGRLWHGIARISGGVDRLLVDGAVDALAEGVIRGGRRLSRLQTGRIHHYATAAALGAVALCALAFFGGQ
jgi:NADH-quinone oxidoreductase subunit L